MQDTVDDLQEFRQPKRFGQSASRVENSSDPAILIVLWGHSGYDDDWHFGELMPKIRDARDAVARHQQVGDNHVGRIGAKQREAFLTAGGGGHVVPGALQGKPDHFANGRVIVDYKKAGHAATLSGVVALGQSALLSSGRRLQAAGGMPAQLVRGIAGANPCHGRRFRQKASRGDGRYSRLLQRGFHEILCFTIRQDERPFHSRAPFALGSYQRRQGPDSDWTRNGADISRHDEGVQLRLEGRITHEPNNIGGYLSHTHPAYRAGGHEIMGGVDVVIDHVRGGAGLRGGRASTIVDCGLWATG